MRERFDTEMKNTGDTEETSQLLVVSNRLSALEYSINGVELEDLK